MDRFPLVAILLAPGLALGCDQPPAGAAASASLSASASVSAAPALPTAVPVAAALPPDLDVGALAKALKCGGEGKTGACGVLAKMASCSAWNPVVPSGDGRWLGHGWLVEGGKTTDQLTLVRARRVPTNEVAPGQLGVKIAVTDLGKQEGQAYEQADRVIRIFERSDTPPKSSPTLEYVKQRTEWPEAFAMRTAGGQQVMASTQDGTYLCEGAKRTVLLVQRGSTHGGSADGLYAEVWPTSW